jgi:hypothetical protein
MSVPLSTTPATMSGTPTRGRVVWIALTAIVLCGVVRECAAVVVSTRSTTMGDGAEGDALQALVEGCELAIVGAGPGGVYTAWRLSVDTNTVCGVM